MEAVSCPVALLHEADGFIVTVELKTGEIYQGVLEGSEDTMNCQLTDVTCTDADGNVSHADSVYIRGSNVMFVVIPDMFANSPMFLDTRVVKGTRDGYAGNLSDKLLANKIRVRYL